MKICVKRNISRYIKQVNQSNRWGELLNEKNSDNITIK